MANSPQTTDVVIIGAGPVGLFAIFECGMLRLSCHVVDPLDKVGGQCTALYPEKPIYDIPAWPEITAAHLIEQLHKQAAPFNPVYHLRQQVVRVDETNDGYFTVGTSAGTTIIAKAVIIAAGVGAFGPNRPSLDNIKDYEDRSVHYFVKSREDFRGKRLVIAGGGDSAIDWTLSLNEVAEQVTLVHRRAKFRAAPESIAKVEDLASSGKIDLVVPYQLSRLEGSDGTLAAVVVATLDGEEKTIPADVLLPFYGLTPNLGPIANWGLNLENKLISVDQKTCATSRSGIYAIGDIAHYDSKLKFILTGFAEATHAAHAVRAQLRPDETFHFEYSTTKGIPAS